MASRLVLNLRSVDDDSNETTLDGRGLSTQVKRYSTWLANDMEDFSYPIHRHNDSGGTADTYAPEEVEMCQWVSEVRDPEGQPHDRTQMELNDTSVALT